MSPQTDARIRELIDQGKYLNVYQFISRAIEGMLHIEEQEIRSDRDGSPSEELLSASISHIKVPTSVELEGTPDNLAKPHEPSELYDVSDNPWLWGQVNSVLCIKFLLRILAKKQLENKGERILFSQFSKEIAGTAISMRRHLLSIDERQGRNRDMRFSISFPRDSEKSRSRFISQYLGYIDSNDRPRGALVWLGFLQITGKRGSESALLTHAGFQFAKLHNPLIDKPTDLAVETALTDEEINFYLKHVLKNTPCESNAIRTTLKLIKEGNNTPQGLESTLNKEKPKWSEAEVATYKGGALARLYQLRMILKKRSDLGLTYELTPASHKIGLS